MRGCLWKEEGAGNPPTCEILQFLLSGNRDQFIGWEHILGMESQKNLLRVIVDLCSLNTRQSQSLCVTEPQSWNDAGNCTILVLPIRKQELDSVKVELAIQFAEPSAKWKRGGSCWKNEEFQDDGSRTMNQVQGPSKCGALLLLHRLCALRLAWSEATALKDVPAEVHLVNL